MDFTVKDGKQKIKGKNSNNSGDKVKLDYKKAIHCIRGSDVTIYDSSNYINISDAIRDAIKNISEKQTSRGVTVLCSGWERNDTIKIVKTVTKFSEQPPIYYLDDGAITAGVSNATEKEMKMWLNDRGNRNLITNINLATGWEDATVIAIDNLSGGGTVDNMCLRTVSSLHIIKFTDIKEQGYHFCQVTGCRKEK